jgi:hypothetical protein
MEVFWKLLEALVNALEAFALDYRVEEREQRKFMPHIVTSDS